MKLQTSKTFKHETKCMNCGHDESRHRSQDKACVIGGSRNFPSYNETGMTFVDSGKPTLKSKRQLEKLLDQESREQLTKELFEKEKSKIRVMSFQEVVNAVIDLLYDKTELGLDVNPISSYEYELHLTTVGPSKIRLGYMNVRQSRNGSYIVGGTYAGCFMANGSGRDILNVLREDFRAIEEKANKEKI